jgi:hypothetical protein
VFFQGLKDKDGLEVVKPVEMDNFEKIILDAFSVSKKDEQRDKRKGRQSVRKDRKDDKKDESESIT